MTLDETVLEDARQARQRLVDFESQTAHARIDYHHAIKKLHAAGGSLREIAEALDLSHQRVHQIVEGPPTPHPGPWLGRQRHRRRRLQRGDFLVRFDAAARQVMVEAQTEADSLRHNYVGTEHIMLALLRRGVGETGVEVEAARLEVVDRIGEGEESAGPLKMPRPFTPRAKRAVEQALVAATAAERERIMPEDLLLAIASDTKGAGGEILQMLGVTPEQLLQQPES